MNEITSNSVVAQQIATAIANSLDNASSGGAIISDTDTTVAGNASAQTAIQAMSDAQTNIVQAIGQAATNLQTVASEFEAADQVTRELLSAITIPVLAGGR